MKKRSSKEIFADTMLTLARTEPVDRITVKQIVEKSGLSLQTFYNHFRDKEDLIVWMHQRGCDRARVRLESKNCSFHDLTMHCVRFFADNANYLRSGFDGGIINPYAEQSVKSAYDFFSAYICKKHGMETLSEELRVYLAMYLFACLHVFAEWSLKGWDLPEDRLAAYLEQGMPERLKPYLLE